MKIIIPGGYLIRKKADFDMTGFFFRFCHPEWSLRDDPDGYTGLILCLLTNGKYFTQ